jgi:CheY-like chemotaxis protein
MFAQCHPAVAVHWYNCCMRSLTLEGSGLMEKRPRILIVDDDRESADVVADLLELSGCDARIAHDGFEAIAAAEDMLPDAVLLDICLPRVDGCETARRLRLDSRFAKTRLVAFSAAEPGPWTAIFDTHVTKPCTFDEVEAALGLVPGGR